MKKRFWRILALILALGLIAVVLYFYNALCGNPLSQMLAERTAETYLEENYPDTDYYIEKVAFSFKFTNYYAHIRSETSQDTQFTLYIDMWGRVEWDTYEDVLSGAITARRLEEEYRALTDQVFESPAFPYPSDIGFGRLEIHPIEAFEDPNVTDVPEWALVADDLILDHVYDIRELGKQAGHLIVYVDSDTVTAELAAQILLDIRREFDKAGIPFRAIDLTLQHPLPEEGPRDDVFIGMDNFAYEDITEEGLIRRVEEADAALKAYYAEQDGK